MQKEGEKEDKGKVAASPIADMVQEFAGNSIIAPSPGTNSELWNCDTGATSHMTPHRHWFKTYTKHPLLPLILLLHQDLLKMFSSQLHHLIPLLSFRDVTHSDMMALLLAHMGFSSPLSLPPLDSVHLSKK